MHQPPRHRIWIALTTTLLVAGLIWWQAPSAQAESPALTTTAQWVREAVSENPTVADAAIAQLRALGPAGLQAMYTAYAPPAAPDAQPARDAEAFYRPQDPIWSRLTKALDRISGQYDNYSSRLYWYTDLAAAQKAAAAEHKPILSLRMLGKLTDEFSCANSRFFRAVLYTDPQVQALLHGNFILHWESVRPVPVVTIDMGDGRVIKRTITGNSIHYVLDEQGRVIDGIPGLYSPKAFATMLAQARELAGQTATQQTADYQRTVANYHAACERRIAAQLQRDTELAAAAAKLEATVNAATPHKTFIPAAAAMPMAMSKSGIERPMVLVVAPQPAQPAPKLRGQPAAGETAFSPTFVAADGAVRLSMSKMLTEQGLIDGLMPATVDAAREKLQAGSTDWASLATVHRAESALQPATVAYMRALKPCEATLCAWPGATTHATADGANDDLTHFLTTLDNFRVSLAEDTVRNEYDFHAKIHDWLRLAAAGQVNVELAQFNDKVYSELFLTPSSDPWLGLVPPDTFSALPRDGLVSVQP